MPDPQLAEVAEAQHVREVEGICVVPLKLVPVGRLLQGQSPAVPVLPKDDDEHIGICACSWEIYRRGSGNRHLFTKPPALALFPDSWSTGGQSLESMKLGVRIRKARSGLDLCGVTGNHGVGLV